MNEADLHKEHQLELARQLLPLATWREVARDGLLCIAGIQGIAAGAVLWRGDDGGAMQLLSHFGLGAGRVRPRYRLAAAVQTFLLEIGPVTLDGARRRAGGRGLLRAMRPLETQLGEAWVLPLHAEGRLRGILFAGPSLVTQELATSDTLASLVDLGDLLRLRLLGCAAAVAARPAAERVLAVAAATRAVVPVAGRSVIARLQRLRRRYPEIMSLVGDSPVMLVLLEEIVSLAETSYTVLVEGETGTGKELAAHLLHRLSRRATGPFEAVDCSSIPQELIESELFGHVKGAFTGASRDFRGAFERADGGTLLLDEIGDMDMRSQTRLLRVLQEGQVRRLGADRPVPIDVRVVAATNRDLVEMVRQGRFREDLYYRIHVCPLRVPALRERGDDRLVLFAHFMTRHAAELERPGRRLSAAARRRLRAEAFPGNVRQMQNVVRQLLVRRDARGSVDEDEIERVLLRASSMTRPPSRAPLTLAPAEMQTPPDVLDPTRSSLPSAAPALRGGLASAGDEVGAWVLERLRAHRFNLSAAARSLADLRRGGASRDAVPVFDRGALDYYLCGEFFRALAAHSYDLDAAVQALAVRAPAVPRLRRKVLSYVRPLRNLNRARPPMLRARLRQAYGRIPDAYQREIDRAAEALRKGRWRLP